MICSQCKNGATNQIKFEGIICKSGHILCEYCGVLSSPCNLCGHKIIQRFEMISGEFPRIQFYPIIEVFSENVTNSKINFIKQPPSTFDLPSSLENSNSSMDRDDTSLDTFESQGASADCKKNSKSICRFLDENGEQAVHLDEEKPAKKSTRTKCQVFKISDISLLDCEKDYFQEQALTFFGVEEPNFSKNTQSLHSPGSEKNKCHKSSSLLSSTSLQEPIVHQVPFPFVLVNETKDTELTENQQLKSLIQNDCSENSEPDCLTDDSSTVFLNKHLQKYFTFENVLLSDESICQKRKICHLKPGKKLQKSPSFPDFNKMSFSHGDSNQQKSKIDSTTTEISQNLGLVNNLSENVLKFLTTELPNCSPDDMLSLIAKLKKLEEAEMKKKNQIQQNSFTRPAVLAYRAYCAPPHQTAGFGNKAVPIEFTSNTKIPLSVDTPLSINQLNFSRDPVQCPISLCEQKKTVSEFCKHLSVDHQRVVKEKIRPGENKYLKLNFTLKNSLGMNCCHRVYLVQDKVTDLGRNEHKNCLPVMLMTKQFHHKQLYGESSNTTFQDTENFCQFIWLTGLYPTDLPLFYNIVLWNRSRKSEKEHIVFSSKIHSLRDPQSCSALYHSGHALMLSGAQILKLSNDKRDMIEIQIIVH